MKIAIIFPPFHHRKFSENLKVVDEEFTLSPPIILAYIAAIAEMSGHNVILIDAHALHLSKDEVLTRLKMFKPDILAFRVDTYNFRETLEWIQYLKLATGLPVIVGGINMSLYPYETMSHREIDFGLIGEAIDTFPQFLYSFENNKSYEDIPGLCWHDTGGELHINQSISKLVDFDNYPFPARHLFLNHIYHSFVSQRKNYTVMLTSTGCPYKCTFCAISALNHYRKRSWKNIIKEIEECYYDYGIREIDFFDATFFINKQSDMKLFQEIRNRNLKIEWTCRSRVNVVDEEILKEASLSGCRMIMWGIESSSQKVLDGINKKICNEETLKAIKVAKKYGIRNLGFLMIGNPDDSEDTITDTIKFTKSLGLDYVQICRTIAKPGTELHKQLIRTTGYDYWRDFVSGKVDEQRIPTPWTNLSQRKTEELLKKSYYSFYFRPVYVYSILRKVKSLDEVMRYIKVGLRMLFHYFYTDIRIFRTSSFVKEIAHIKLTPANRINDNISIIIPTYNESGNIINLLKRIIAFYPTFNIVVVDSSSTDETYKIVKDFGRVYSQVNAITIQKYGKGNERGNAVKEGYRTALSKGAGVIIEMDSDFSHDPAYIYELLKEIDDFDVVVGSRYVSGAKDLRKSILRKVLSYLANLYLRYILGIRDISDCTSGYRCYRRDILEKISIDSIESIEGTAVLLEVLNRAIRNGARIKEVPIIYNDRLPGKSKFGMETIFNTIKAGSSVRG